MGESYEDEVDDDRVSEMNVSFWTCVKVNVVLNRDAFCFWCFIELRFSTVDKSFCKRWQMYDGEVHIWHHWLNHHGLNDFISDHIVPVLCKITKLISDWKPAQRCVIEVSIRQQKYKTSIQKLGIKHKSHDRHGNFTFFIESDLLDEEDIHNSEDSIKNNNSDGHEILVDEDLELSVFIIVA